MAQEENATRNRDMLERFNEIIAAADYDALDEVLDPDFIQDIPQSGERVRGIGNFRKTLENYPGSGGTGIAVARDPYIAGHGPHYLMTPTFNVVKVEGAGDELTSYVKATYPDGSNWYIITFTTFKGSKICKRVAFFAPFFEPPSWRVEWSEPMPASREPSAS